jgi:hypothetical protein
MFVACFRWSKVVNVIYYKLLLTAVWVLASRGCAIELRSCCAIRRIKADKYAVKMFDNYSVSNIFTACALREECFSSSTRWPQGNCSVHARG